LFNGGPASAAALATLPCSREPLETGPRICSWTTRHSPVARPAGGVLLGIEERHEHDGPCRRFAEGPLDLSRRSLTASSIGTQAYAMFFSRRGDQRAFVTYPTSRPAAWIDQNSFISSGMRRGRSRPVAGLST
jgi:hypothetical protein